MEESDVEEKDRIEGQKRIGICAIPVLPSQAIPWIGLLSLNNNGFLSNHLSRLSLRQWRQCQRRGMFPV